MSPTPLSRFNPYEDKMKKRLKKDASKSPKPADGDVGKIIACVVSDLSIEKDADVTKDSDLVVGRASEKDAGVKSSGLVYVMSV